MIRMMPPIGKRAFSWRVTFGNWWLDHS
jgi:hypothetical protein